MENNWRFDWRRLWPILAVDFFFWIITAGSAPLMSRIAEARLHEDQANLIIARMILFFTVGSICGRYIAGRVDRQPRVSMSFACLVAALAFLLFHTGDPRLWLLGQILQGLSMGVYGVSVIALTSSLIPAQSRMRGFALVGLADFMGFAVGPILSGALGKHYSLTAVVWVFFALGLLATGMTFICPRKGGSEGSSSKSDRKLPWQAIKRLLPLQLTLLISLLFHVFYSRYLPILFETEILTVESLFFMGYIVGGIIFRLGFVRVMERMSLRKVFFLAILSMTLTACFVAVFPFLPQHLVSLSLLTGFLYGIGFEVLYIFCLVWTSANTTDQNRAKGVAFVFFGFDGSALFAGVAFGPLVEMLTPMGLFNWLLVLLVPYLLLPVFLREKEVNEEAKRIVALPTE